MKKRVLSMLLALCLIVGLLPVTTVLQASAAGTDFVLNNALTNGAFSTSTPVLANYYTYKNQIALGETKYYYHTPSAEGATTTVLKVGDENNWSLKIEYRTDGTVELTLNNLNLNNTCGLTFGQNTLGTKTNADITCTVPLVIKLVGDNYIRAGGHASYGPLNLFTKGKVTIEGAGSLTLDTNRNTDMGAIAAYGDLLLDEVDVKILLDDKVNNKSTAISSMGGDVVINGGNLVVDGYDAHSGNNYEAAKHLFFVSSVKVGDETVGGNLTIQGGANVSAMVSLCYSKDDSDGTAGDGIVVDGDFTIKDSDVEIGMDGPYKAGCFLFIENPVLDFAGGYTVEASTMNTTYSTSTNVMTHGTLTDYAEVTDITTLRYFRVTHKCVEGEPVAQPVADCATKAQAFTYCTICGKKVNETSAVVTPTVEHTPGSPTEVRVEATTTADGYYYYVTECTECKEEISRTEEVVIKKNPDVFYFNFRTNYPAIGNAKAIAIGTTAYYKTYTETLGNGNETVGLTTGNADTWNLKIEYPITGPATITLKDLNMKTAGVGLIFGQNTYKQLSTTTCDIPINVVLEGTNVIDTTVYYTNAHVLGGLSFYTTGDVTISGDGSLSLIDDKGTNNDCYTAGTIYALGNLYFDNVDVSVTLKETSNKAHAISTVGGDIVIDGGRVVVNAIDDPSTKGTDDKKTDLQGEAVRSVFYATNNGTKGGNLTIKNNAYVTAYASPYGNSGDDEFYYIVDIDGTFTVVDSIVELAITGQWFGTRVFKPGVVPVMTFANGSDAKGGSYYGSTSAIVPANTAAYDAELVNDYSYFKAAAKPYKFLGTQLELKDALDIRFGISKAVTTMDGYVVFSVNGGEPVRKEMSEVVEDLPNYYAVVYPGMAAKQMRDEVSVTIYDKYGNQVSETMTNSIYNYAVGRLQNSTDVGFKTLLMDMLNYGAMAQTKFEYNTENLANAGLDDYKHYATATMKTCVDYSTKVGEGHLGTQLELENNIFMRMAVLTEAVGPNAYAVITYTDYLGDEITATVQGTVQDGVAYTAFQFDKMVAADCRQVSTWKFYKDDGTLVTTVTDSIESYVSRRVGINTYLKEMMIYCDSALNYFGNK